MFNSIRSIPIDKEKGIVPIKRYTRHRELDVAGEHEYPENEEIVDFRGRPNIDDEISSSNKENDDDEEENGDDKSDGDGGGGQNKHRKITSLADSIENNEEIFKIETDIPSFDRLLGDGIQLGKSYLIGGEPGVGKSTLIMQAAANVAFISRKKILYGCGEEGVSQLTERAKRLGILDGKDGKRIAKNFKTTDSNLLENLVSDIKKYRPLLVILDSIQVFESEELPSVSGSPSQCMFITQNLCEMAKRLDFGLIVVCQINKNNTYAGPKKLEHLVDANILLTTEAVHKDDFKTIKMVTTKNRMAPMREVFMNMGPYGFEEIEISSPKKKKPIHRK